jgi:sugar transferase (PEP-CTERM/EpsH1 system associated)
MDAETRPLVAHVVYRFAVGGLENGLVNLINRLPSDQWRHAIISLTDHTQFASRVSIPDVTLVDLNKREGVDLGWYWRLWTVLRQLNPAIVHTRNFPTLEAQAVAFAAGVRARVHGEHGRDVHDPTGTNLKHLFLRRALDSFVNQYVTVSRDLATWLQDCVHVDGARVAQIYNGVDSSVFAPGVPPSHPPGAPDWLRHRFVVGTVGRMASIKNQTLLARAFAQAIREHPELRAEVGLVMVGDGTLRRECAEVLALEGLSDLSWLPGERDDVARLMRSFNLFVLPSVAEGISNTILEAMASSLPVIATRVGGNPELVEEGVTGELIPAGDRTALADAIRFYVCDREAARRHGRNGRLRVEREFSVEMMVKRYQGLYGALVMGLNR